MTPAARLAERLEAQRAAGMAFQAPPPPQDTPAEPVISPALHEWDLATGARAMVFYDRKHHRHILVDTSRDGSHVVTQDGAGNWISHESGLGWRLDGRVVELPRSGTEAADDWPDPRPLPRRGELGAADPFPLEHLPPALQAAAAEVSRFVDVDVASPALVGIGALATAIGKRATIEERPGLHHYPALFLVGIAPSGERKSPVFRAMTRALTDWCELMVPVWEADSRRAKGKAAAIDAASRAILSAAGKSGADVDAVAAELADMDARREAPRPIRGCLRPTPPSSGCSNSCMSETAPLPCCLVKAARSSMSSWASTAARAGPATGSIWLACPATPSLETAWASAPPRSA